MSSSGLQILGLDVSTSITGLTVVSGEEVLTTLFLDTRNKNKFPTLYDKADFIRQKLLEIEDNYNIDAIFLEQSLQSFRTGFSSAKTLSTLSRINGMISWVCFDIFEIKPHLLAATTARKTAGLKIKRGDNSKEKALEFMLDRYPDIVVEYTKHGNPKPGTYDMCDSLIIAIAGASIVRKT